MDTMWWTQTRSIPSWVPPKNFRRCRMLMDVLENAPNSPFADFFDIDWNHPVESMQPAPWRDMFVLSRGVNAIFGVWLRCHV